MKTIAILYPAFYEQSNGGAELQIRYLVASAAGVGHTIHYLFEDKGRTIQNELNVILHPLKKKADIKFCGKGWFRYRKLINKELDRIRPDVIYTRLGSSWIDIAAEYARKHDIQHIHAIASDIDVRRRTFSTLFPLFQPFENFYINRGLKHVTIAISQNAYQKTAYEKRFKKPCILINQMTPRVNENEIIKDNGTIRIVWIANFKRIKRPEIFVNLAKALEKYSDRIKMEMYGRASSEYRELLKSIKNTPWLEYKGEVPTETIFNVLSQSHILVNTSLYEGFSNTFVQAWMRKVPIISMGSNPNNVFDNYNVGLFIPQEKDLASALVNLIDHPATMKHMADDAYNYAIVNHSLEQNMPKILNIL